MNARALVVLAALAGLVPVARAAAPHPVVTLLDEEDAYLSNEAPVVWNLAHEAALDEIAASTQARSAGARESLRAEFEKGRLLAGGVLWKLTSDSGIVDRVLKDMASQGPLSPAGVTEYAFVLGYSGDRRAVPGLWAAVERFRGRPYDEIFCARAIYRLSGDPKALSLIRGFSRKRDSRWPKGDMAPSRLAKLVADELERKSGGIP